MVAVSKRKWERRRVRLVVDRSHKKGAVSIDVFVGGHCVARTEAFPSLGAAVESARRLTQSNWRALRARRLREAEA